MPEPGGVPLLHVEGRDDSHSIRHLVKRHGIEYKSTRGAPCIKQIGSDAKLLKVMPTAVQMSTNLSIGFVLDADKPIQDRWKAVCARLKAAEVDDVPSQPPADGFIGKSERYKATVGVWLMPDNQSDGNLEDFLETLIYEKDGLIDHASSATKKAQQIGAQFTDTDIKKAVIHAWLAWQEVPGLPYGTAIKSRYFRHDSDVAMAFVVWFKKLFGIS